MENEVTKYLRNIKAYLLHRHALLAVSCMLIYAQQNLCVIILSNSHLTKVPLLPCVGHFRFPQLENFPNL